MNRRVPTPEAPLDDSQKLLWSGVGLLAVVALLVLVTPRQSAR